MKKSAIQGELWGRSPNGWADIQEPMSIPLWEAMLDATGVGEGTVLLDVGCGSGGGSALARQRGAEVHGVDVASGLLSIARARVPDASFQLADIEDLPFADKVFDVVFAANSLQYSDDRVAALQELKRVCKPKGRIVAGMFGSPEKVDYKVVFGALRDAMPEPPKGGGPFELSMPGKLEELFREAGLSDLNSHEVNCPFAYADFETFWYGNASAGPIQGMLNAVPETTLKSAVRAALHDYELEDGSILIPTNVFKYVTALVE